MLVLKSTYNELLRELEDVEEQLDEEAAERAKFARESARLKGALFEILKQQTRSPNATVSRILKIAEDALNYNPSITIRDQNGNVRAKFGIE